MMLAMRPAAGSADVFHAIADPNRRRLIDLLASGEKPVQELADDFEITLAAVSQHLGVLRRAGLVTSRARGRQRLYRLRPAGLRAVDDWTARYRKFWQRRIKRLQALLDEGA
jgi:DNA-binding transcriptional ArsR family regulator